MTAPVLTEKQVQRAIREVLAELTTPPYSSYKPGIENTRRCALEKLYSLRYISNPHVSPNLPYRLTAEGWEYWKRLRLGILLYWLKCNWFPFIIALISTAVGIGAILVGLIGQRCN